MIPRADRPHRGRRRKARRFPELLRNYEIVELVRSGKIAMTRGLATT